MVSYMNDFITPCPEATFLNCLNMMHPGLGVCISSYYGKPGIAWYSFGLGAGLMVFAAILEICAWICFYIGEWGIALSWTIVGLVLCVAYIFTLICEILWWCCAIYAVVHCFFCMKKYIDMIKEGLP